MPTFDILTAVLTILMAMCGTIARLLNTHEAQNSKPSAILADLFVSGFTGLLLYWAVLSMPIEQGWAFAGSGVSGWVGPRMLDTIAAHLAKKAGIDSVAPQREREKMVPDIEPEPEEPQAVSGRRENRRPRP